MIAFVLPGLFLTVRLSLCDSVVVNEEEWGSSAIRRSYELTHGKFLPLAILCFVLVLLSIWNLECLFDSDGVVSIVLHLANRRSVQPCWSIRSKRTLQSACISFIAEL